MTTYPNPRRVTASGGPYWVTGIKPPRPCTAHDLTWGPRGAQCLNCGSEAEHTYDLKHAPQEVQS